MQQHYVTWAGCQICFMVPRCFFIDEIKPNMSTKFCLVPHPGQRSNVAFAVAVLGLVLSCNLGWAGGFSSTGRVGRRMVWSVRVGVPTWSDCDLLKKWRRQRQCPSPSPNHVKSQLKIESNCLLCSLSKTIITHNSYLRLNIYIILSTYLHNVAYCMHTY